MVATSTVVTQTIIDRLLEDAGWILTSRSHRKLVQENAVVIRGRTIHGIKEPCLLVVNQQILGVIHMIQGLEEEGIGSHRQGTQADTLRLPRGLCTAAPLLPFSYVCDGKSMTFTNWLEPGTRARRVSGFHRPETLMRWMKEGTAGRGEGSRQTLLTLLQQMRSHPLPEGDAALQTIVRMLDQSWSGQRRRTLLALPEGTDRACFASTYAERLVRFAEARSLLFLFSRPQARQAAKADHSWAEGETGLPGGGERPRTWLSSGTVYALEEARVFVYDARHMAHQISAWPIEAFDVVFAFFDSNDEVHPSDLRILAHFDAVIVGVCSGDPSRELVEWFGNAIYPCSRNDVHLRTQG